MCGIVGVITGNSNGFSNKELDVFTQMLFLDTLRGWDSTGVAGVCRDGNVAVLKEATAAPDFIRTKAYDNFKIDAIARGKILFAHNRAATRGSIKDENAHPFIAEIPNSNTYPGLDTRDNIILVQNGTWNGSHKSHHDTEVDTEALTRIIAEEEDIEAAFSKIDAAYALAWYNTKQRTFNLIRNEDRPLWVLYPKNHSVLFASEHETIVYAALKNGVVAEKEPFLLKANTLITFTLDMAGKVQQNVVENLKGKPRYSSVANKHNAYDEDAEYGVYARHALDENTELKPPVVSPTKEVVDAHRGVLALPSPSNRKPAGPSKANDPTRIDITFMEHVQKRLEEAHTTQPNSFHHYERIRSRQNGRILVETVEYFPVNNHTNCSAWFIASTIVSVDSPKVGEPDGIIYWIVSGKTEADVMEMIGNFFYVTVTSISINQFRNEEGPVWAAVALAIRPEQFSPTPTTTTKTQQQNVM